MLSEETVSTSTVHSPSKQFDDEYRVCCSTVESLMRSNNVKVESVSIHSSYLHRFTQIEPKHLSYIKLSAVGYWENFVLLWIDATSHSPSHVSWAAVRCIFPDYRRGFEKTPKTKLQTSLYDFHWFGKYIFCIFYSILQSRCSDFLSLAGYGGKLWTACTFSLIRL